jgi:hypothetical protein
MDSRSKNPLDCPDNRSLSCHGGRIHDHAVNLPLPTFHYPQYAASLFAANDFARSFFAGGCIVFSRLMFKSLGVAKGVTLLGGLTVRCTAGLLVLYFYGAELRKRSKFAVK